MAITTYKREPSLSKRQYGDSKLKKMQAAGREKKLKPLAVKAGASFPPTQHTKIKTV